MPFLQELQDVFTALVRNHLSPSFGGNSSCARRPARRAGASLLPEVSQVGTVGAAPPGREPDRTRVTFLLRHRQGGLAISGFLPLSDAAALGFWHS
ncbi:hypothetical protein ACFQRF_22985 [Marinactinospora rubrisoli]|uniref:Uncharacterized protein n=1 Tax=Marinactinospora rubrisoli TaxID=2715399 RepID=A0ABW2KKS4_9ACTN